MSGQWYGGQREQQWWLHRPLGEGIPLLGGLLSSTRKVLSFTAQLLVCAVPHSQPGSLLLWPSTLLHQKSSRRAVLGRPPALQEALFWVSMLMLCCKCILFKGCTNYKLVLGDEDKNIFSQLVSVNNLWCYLEARHSFHVAGNAHAAREGLQQSWCRASSWSGWQIKRDRNFFLSTRDGKVDINEILFHAVLGEIWVSLSIGGGSVLIIPSVCRKSCLPF